MLEAVGLLAVMGGVFGAILALAAKKFEVKTDPRVQKVLTVLPGANCGACGLPGCAALAEAIVAKSADANACMVAKTETRALIAAIMGQSLNISLSRQVARLRCHYPYAEAAKLYNYQGIEDCHLAVTLFSGSRLCNYGCFGLASCVRTCPFNAIKMDGAGSPQIDYNLCTGCGLCVSQCPQMLLYLEDAGQTVHIGCHNLDRGKAAMDVCPQACISCGLCVKACPSQAITMENYKNGGSLPAIDSQKCTQCGACIEKCPRKCIRRSLPLADHPAIAGGGEKTGCAACGLCGDI